MRVDFTVKENGTVNNNGNYYIVDSYNSVRLLDVPENLINAELYAFHPLENAELRKYLVSKFRWAPQVKIRGDNIFEVISKGDSDIFRVGQIIHYTKGNDWLNV